VTKSAKAKRKRCAACGRLCRPGVDLCSPSCRRWWRGGKRQRASATGVVAGTAGRATIEDTRDGSLQLAREFRRLLGYSGGSSGAENRKNGAK